MRPCIILHRVLFLSCDSRDVVDVVRHDFERGLAGVRDEVWRKVDLQRPLWSAYRRIS